MKSYIFTKRNGIHIIDLEKTVVMLDKACAFVRETVALGDSVLFVGTKKQAQESIKEEATRCGMYYVNQRWLGGMLTNFSHHSGTYRPAGAYGRPERARRVRPSDKKGNH